MMLGKYKEALEDAQSAIKFDNTLAKVYNIKSWSNI